MLFFRAPAQKSLALSDKRSDRVQLYRFNACSTSRFCSDGDGDLGSGAPGFLLRIVIIIHTEIIKANLSRSSYFSHPDL